MEAVGVARQRSWQYDWCIDLDIKGFFDNLDHELMMKAVKFHTEAKWIHLYIKKWLEAPQQIKSGEMMQRESGTPQGGVISPLLANIFMHHAFDEWMKRNFPKVKFERFADDIVTHCISYKQAEEMLEEIKIRLRKCNLEVHPDKTKIVYCKDQKRKGSYENENFDFLGYTFRPRLTQNKRGKKFVGFLPAVSRRSAKQIRQEIRSWNIQLKSDKNLTDLARMFNIKVQGWVNYYGAYYPSEFYPILDNVEHYLVRWAMRKYKRLRGRKRQAKKWLKSVRKRETDLFVHWRLSLKSQVG